MFRFESNGLDVSHKQDFASSPKDEYGKHIHRFFELIYFVSGEVEYHIESERQDAQVGDIFLIKPGQYHFAGVNKNVPYERYVLKFPEDLLPPKLLDKALKADSVFPFRHEVGNIVKSLDNLREINDDDDFEILCKCKIVELMVVLLGKGNNMHVGLRDQLVSRIISFIEANIDKGVTISDIANALSYSESYIVSSFKQSMQIPLMKYIRSKKVFYAHDLISQGFLPEKVADMLGFNDYSTFYRAYCKVIGEPPSQTKKKSTSN